jgi:hypothetical protein
MRRNALGLDPALDLSFEEEIPGSPDALEDVVVVQAPDGMVVGFVEFGRDELGRYFPNRAVLCASTGIEDFT